jgi:hypothetical protein
MANASDWGQSASERAQRPASEQMNQAARQGMDTARDMASSAAEQASEAWRTARDAAPAYAARAGDVAKDAYQQGQQIARRVGGQIPEQWTTLLAGVALGYIIGYVIHSR